jgi:hypothetical protein
LAPEISVFTADVTPYVDQVYNNNSPYIVAYRHQSYTSLWHAATSFATRSQSVASHDATDASLKIESKNETTFHTICSISPIYEYVTTTIAARRFDYVSNLACRYYKKCIAAATITGK